MRFNEAWLRDWVNPDLDTEQLCHQLSMTGLEVDGVEPAAPAFSNVIVAEVKEVASHPDADKLRVCQVDTGDGLCPVVCGADNVYAGMKAPLARVGAVLPGGDDGEPMEIRKTKLRGQPSEGMLCGASELGLEDRVDGLLELPADAPVGRDLRDYLELDDTVIEVDLTPNRADCLSLRGIAREVAVLGQTEVRAPGIEPVPAVIDDRFPVQVTAQRECPRYLGRVVRGVNPAAETPLWMRERLRRAGLRSIDAVVDVTNYVLLELGQPLHAFDLDRLRGGIQVRLAAPQEKLTLLDGQELMLDEDTLVIADESAALALAGVMGGQGSAVGPESRNIFLECAFFAPEAIAGRARRYGLHTDSSHRFERGVDPALQEQALERTTALILEIAGGEPGPVEVAESAGHVPAAAEISLRASRIEQVLGISLEAGEVEDILSRLGMQVAASGDGWSVRAPSWRFDMAIEEDLLEELARVYGYDRLPSRLPRVPPGEGGESERRVPVRRLVDTLIARGYQEAITYSFVEPAVQRLLDPEVEPLALANPISADLAVMRTTLWAGLLGAARHNLNRQGERLRLFETGLRFVPGEDGLVQEPVLAGLLHGSAAPRHWDQPARKADFFDLKGDVEAVLALAAPGGLDFRPAEHSALHPGQCARVMRGDRVCGWLGRLHPMVATELDLPSDILLFELEVAAITQASVPKFEEIPDQPSMRRDLALVVADPVTAGELVSSARDAADERLREIRVFDVYQGPGVAEGHKSLALGLTFQDRSRTLTEGEINDLVAAILSRLKQEFKASLRE